MKPSRQAHNLRRPAFHRSARRLRNGTDMACPAEVPELTDFFAFSSRGNEQDIARGQIAVYNSALMAVAHRCNDLEVLRDCGTLRNLGVRPVLRPPQQRS